MLGSGNKWLVVGGNSISSESKRIEVYAAVSLPRQSGWGYCLSTHHLSVESSELRPRKTALAERFSDEPTFQ